MENYIKKMSKKKYEIVNRTGNSVQMKRPKRWSRLLLITGLVALIIPPFFIGAIILILAVVDYMLKREHVIYTTADEIAAGKQPNARPILVTPVLIGISILTVFVLMVMLFLSFAS